MFFSEVMNKWENIHERVLVTENHWLRRLVVIHIIYQYLLDSENAFIVKNDGLPWFTGWMDSGSLDIQNDDFNRAIIIDSMIHDYRRTAQTSLQNVTLITVFNTRFKLRHISNITTSRGFIDLTVTTSTRFAIARLSIAGVGWCSGLPLTRKWPNGHILRKMKLSGASP